jgi:hypothetical protein
LKRLVFISLLVSGCIFSSGKLISYENKNRIQYFKEIPKPIECVNKIEEYIIDSLTNKPIFGIKYYEISTIERAIYFAVHDTTIDNNRKEYLIIINRDCELEFAYKCKLKEDGNIEYW